MKLRNKKTGEIVVFGEGIVDLQKIGCKNVAEMLEAGWEDYEEPKVGYIIDPMEEDYVSADDSGYEESDVERAKELGIWLETKEEAEKAVEKLKAWKRLKDKGFEFTKWEAECMSGKGTISTNFNLWEGLEEEVVEDLDLLFRSEDE